MLRQRIIVFSILILFFFLVFGCSSTVKLDRLPADAAWAKINKLYQKGKYLDVVDRLEIFLINHAGVSMADSAQFLLAEAHFNLKQYITAASEYERTVVQYPQSRVAEQAEYKLGLSYYKLSPKYSLEQSYTNKAINAFQLFIEDYPMSPLVAEAQDMIGMCRSKLARKAFENARLYSRMKENLSARIYYNMVLQDFYDTKYAPMALYYWAESFEKSRLWDDAVRGYNLFLEKYADHPWAPKALEALNRALSNAPKIIDKESSNMSGAKTTDTQ